MKCGKCGYDGRDGWQEIFVDQDPMGNDLYGLCCPQCEEVVLEQETAGQCLHLEYERDEIGRYWCAECGEYLGERNPF